MTTVRPSLSGEENKGSAAEREARLLQIRREAELHAGEAELRAPVKSGTITREGSASGYYGLPLLKAPPWTWEVPIYFFVGGAAGAAAVIASVAKWNDAEPGLIRDARWIGAVGGMISPALLVSDLGYPRRFINMLRVFKLQSPMSVGSWTLVVFSSSAAAALLSTVQRHPRGLVRAFLSAGDVVAAISGTVLATYTGVLIGATAVPVWHENISILPMHFAMSGLASATSLLELRGHETPALNALGIAGCAGESLIGLKIELDQRRVNEPLKKGKSGWLTRIGGILSGPLPLALRLLAGNSRSQRSVRLRKAAAVSSIAGSLITRVAWIAAGKISAREPQLELEPATTQLRNTELVPAPSAQL